MRCSLKTFVAKGGGAARAESGFSEALSLRWKLQLLASPPQGSLHHLPVCKPIKQRTLEFPCDAFYNLPCANAARVDSQGGVMASTSAAGEACDWRRGRSSCTRQTNSDRCRCRCRCPTICQRQLHIQPHILLKQMPSGESPLLLAATASDSYTAWLRGYPTSGQPYENGVARAARVPIFKTPCCGN